MLEDAWGSCWLLLHSIQVMLGCGTNWLAAHNTVVRACHCLRLRSCFGGVRRFPLESSALAPGMCAEVDVCFTPDSLGDYEDAFAVETPAGRFEVQLTGRRPHPDLTLPPVLEVCLHDNIIMPPDGGHQHSCSSCKGLRSRMLQQLLQGPMRKHHMPSGLHIKGTATAT